MTTPSTPGPEVGFVQAVGPMGLRLGTHACNGALGANYPQTPGVFEPVLYIANPTVFCIYSLSDSGEGSFEGKLLWD